MEWNNKYTYPKSSRSIENGYRKYLFGDEKLPSVTTILSATKSDEEKADEEFETEKVEDEDEQGAIWAFDVWNNSRCR